MSKRHEKKLVALKMTWIKQQITPNDLIKMYEAEEELPAVPLLLIKYKSIGDKEA
jgi:hypothetical protein